MRILTYSNPFEIDRNNEVWEIITKHPHYCASETLKQGLEAYYKRDSFSFLSTIETLVDTIIGEFTNNSQLNLQLYLDISNYLREFEQINDRNKNYSSEEKYSYKMLIASFRFNISDVIKAISILFLTGCNIEKFDYDNLTQTERILLEIFGKVTSSSYFDELQNLKKIDFNTYFIKSSEIIVQEVEYLMREEDGPFNESLGSGHINGLDDVLEILEKYIDSIEKQMQNPLFGFEGEVDNSYKLPRVKHLKSLIENRNSDSFKTIVVHGVHRITPEMFMLFGILEKIGVEVIFLINYAKNLPNVYRTWRNVYDWCNVGFEYTDNLDLNCGSDLGKQVALTQEGKNTFLEFNWDIIRFNNLTSFTDREVRETFLKARKKLSRMNTQYYAVDGNSSNEILKMYFPEQFNIKPFLSYPIGQFVLGIYNMWDFKKNQVKIDFNNLLECAVSKVFVNDDNNIIEIIDKIRLYFSDISIYDDFICRLDKLYNSNIIVRNRKEYCNLAKVSFFSLSDEEINGFRDFLKFIQEISYKLFFASDPTVNIVSHFRSLIDFLSKQTLKSKHFSKEELDLITEISERLEKSKDRKVTGHIEDVKDALFYFVEGRKGNDSSKWIVRDFEQIDGSVLMKNTSKAEYHHYALLSNSNMTKSKNDELPWPLTISTFLKYKDTNTPIPAIAAIILERPNFLKFTFFYGVFFTAKVVKFSFIEEENGEKQEPYYMFSLLGANIVEYTSNVKVKLRVLEENYRKVESDLDYIEDEDRELFAICQYKFLLNKVLKASIEYKSDFHVKYFVSNFMVSYLNNRVKDTIVDSKCIEIEFNSLRSMFPFWNDIVFEDVKRETIKQLKARKNPNQAISQKHLRIKGNFLIAQWEENGKKFMKFSLDRGDREIAEYMMSDSLYPDEQYLPHKKICENCNFGDICLRYYYETESISERSEKHE